MRDRFRKDHSMYEKSGSSPCKIKKYIHYDELLFLAPSRTLRKTHGNIPHAEPSTSQENVDQEHSSDDPMEENQEADMEGILLHEMSDSPPAIVEPPTRPSNVTTRRQQRTTTRKTTNAPAFENAAVSFLQRASREDAYDGFGRVTAGECRRLPENKRNIYMTFAINLAQIMLDCHVIPGIDVLVTTIRTVLPPRHEVASLPDTQHVQRDKTHYSSHQSSQASHFEQRKTMQSANVLGKNTQPSLLQMLRDEPEVWSVSNPLSPLQTVTALPPSTFDI